MAEDTQRDPQWELWNTHRSLLSLASEAGDKGHESRLLYASSVAEMAYRHIWGDSVPPGWASNG